MPLIDIAETMTELTAMPIHDRLRVVESSWDSIPADSPVESGAEQRAELQRRLRAAAGWHAGKTHATEGAATRPD